MKKILILLLICGINQFIFSQLPSYVPTNGLVGYYTFSGNSNDVSGNGNNGTVHGCSLTTDRFGNPNSSYYFNGINNYIEIPNSSSLQITGPISITCWVYPDTIQNPTTTQGMRIVDKSTVGQGDGYLLDMGENNGMVPGNEYRSRFIGGSIYNDQPRSTEFYSTDSVWWNITLTYDGSQVIFYLNGVIDTIIPFTVSETINNNPIIIGGNSLLNGTWFYGKMDDIGIYNRSLTQSEVIQLYNQSSTCSVYDTISVTDTLIIHSNLTGINPPNNINTLLVYPNPTSSEVIINTGNYSTMNGYTLKVVNVLGQSVFQSLINQQIFTQSIVSWGGNGTYFVEIFDTSNTLIDKRVIIVQ